MPSPTTLAIDTAAPRLQLALLGDDGRVDVSVDEIATGHAELLFDRVNALLHRNGVDYATLERIVTTTGPGSFTGLRIGLAAARGLGLARALPVVGVPSLLALSLGVDGPSAVLLDARRGEVYVQRFAGPGLPLSAPRLLAMDAAQALVTADPALITSPFVDIERVAKFGAVADPALFPPDAAYVRDADAKPQSAARIARVTP